MEDEQPKKISTKEDRSADIQALSEENEALRKGLHEILNSVQVRNGLTGCIRLGKSKLKNYKHSRNFSKGIEI